MILYAMTYIVSCVLLFFNKKINFNYMVTVKKSGF